MVLGSTKHWKLYITEKSNDLIGAKTFTDYSGHVIDWQVDGSMNTLSTIEATFIDMRTNQAKLDLSKGNIIYLMSKQKLVGKFVIQKPIYRNDGTIHVTGIQSTGTEKVNRKVQQENMPKIKYDNILTCDILCSTCNTCQGVLVDSAEQKILTLNAGHPGSATDRFAVEYDNENRIEAISKLAGVTGQEWWIEHGTNDATPYSEGDTLSLDDRKGSATSTYTFYVRNNVGTQNCQISEGGEDVETNVNDVRVEGIDQANNQIISCAHDSQGTYTYMTSDKILDGWLKDDISDGQSGSGDPGETYIDLVTGSMGSLLTEGLGAGEDATIRIDNERIFVCGISNACGWPRLTIDSRDCAITNTEGTPHLAGADAIYQNRNTSKVRLYVDCKTKLCSGGDMFVGSEPMECVGGGTGYVEVYRMWSHVYAHGKGIKVCSGCYTSDKWVPANPANELVFNLAVPSFGADEVICGLTSGACAVTINNPSACVVTVCDVVGNFTISETVCATGTIYGTLWMDYSQNSIQQNGIYSKTISNNSPKNRHNLDMVAQRILETKKLPIKRITLVPQSSFDVWDTVSLGDLVTLGDGTEIGFSNGDTVRVTGYCYKFQGGMPSLEIYCNDPDTRTYASTTTNYVEQKQETERAKQQDAVRKVNQFETSSSGAGYTGSWGTGLKRLTDVQSPTDDYDAANKKYVDACSGGVGGKWCDFSGGLATISDKNLCMKSHIRFDSDDRFHIGSICRRACAVYTYYAIVDQLEVDHIYPNTGSNITMIPTNDLCVCGPVKIGACPYYGDGSNLSGVVTGLAKGGSSLLTCNVYLCEGSNITLTQTGQCITVASTGGGSGLWANANPFDAYITPCNSCGLCITGDLVSANSTNCLGVAGSPGAWKEVHGNCIRGATCICSPQICGTTRVRGPTLYGSTLVCSATVCGTSIVKGADVCATDDVHAGNCVIASEVLSGAYLNINASSACRFYVSGNGTYAGTLGITYADTTCACASRKMVLPVGTNCY